MLRLLSQMMKLPIAAFVYDMEVLVKAMRDFQRTADHSLDTMVSAIAQVPAEGQPGPDDQAMDANAGAGARAYEQTARSGERAAEARTALEEDGHMGDSKHDLNDDDLKLIRYKILFVKRDYEVAFPEVEELVSDNLSSSAFTGWKIAEFIQRLQTGEVRAPLKWRKDGKRYPDDVKPPDWKVLKLPEEDKKYLRVYYEVLDRYVREKFKYEEEQVDVLREIRDRLKPPSGSATGGASGGTGAGPGGGGHAGGGMGTP